MPRHYIKLRSSLEDLVRQIDPGVNDWEAEVIRDITENGTLLVIETLQPTDQGPRVGLCGDKFYCEAGPDRDRNDCVFVFRVLDAAQRTPRSIPRRYSAQIHRFEGRYSKELDSTEEIWEVSPKGGTLFSVAASLEPFKIDVGPSEQLQKLLASIPQDIRKAWHPGTHIQEPANPDEFLKLIRRPWAKFKLDRFVRLTTRQDSLIKGLIPNPSLARQERSRLLALFDLNMLNGFVRNASDPKDLNLSELLRTLAVLPLSNEVRARIWGSMARTLESDVFVRELTEVSAKLNQDLSTRNGNGSEWWQHLSAVLSWRMKSLREEHWSNLLQECDDAPNPLESFALWIQDNIVAPNAGRDADTPEVQGDVFAVLNHESVKIEPLNEQFKHELPTALSTDVSIVYEWLFGLQGLDNESLNSTLEDIRITSEQLIAASSAPIDIQTISDLSSLLLETQEKIQEWLSNLPEFAASSAEFTAGLNAYRRAHDLIGSNVDELLRTSLPSPRDLFEAANLFEREDLLHAMPVWVWTRIGEGSANSVRERIFRELVLPQVRETVISVLSAAGEYATFDPLLISLVPAPPVSDDPESQPMTTDQHVRSWFERMGSLVKEMPQDILLELRSDPHPLTLEARIRQALGLERKLRDQLPRPVLLDAMRDMVQLRSEREAIDRADLYVQALQFWEENFGASSKPTFAQLKAWVERQSKVASSRTMPELRSDIRIENNWIDTHGTKVPLLYVPNSDQTTKPYGYVTIPLVVISKRKQSFAFGIECDVKSGHRDAWPRDWETPQPSSLNISQEAWRDDPDQPDQYLHTFKLKIPVRRSGRGQRFEFTLTLLQSDQAVAGTYSFSWDVMNDLLKSSLLLSWPEVVDPKNVEKHPLGPQKKSTELLARVSQCGSFSITAPRRFGKSTLTEFLQVRAQQSGFVVPSPVVCTSYYSGQQGINYERLWEDVSDRLQKELGSSMSRSENPIVPSENAFDHIRKSAKVRGKKGVLLLFDEAQLYFSQRSGTVTGDQIKDRLERHWSLNSDRMVPLTFGFIGLPTLQARAGANLNGLLRPVQYSSLEEADLNKLILAVTNGSLNTTREARVRLARVAGNLYILRTLIEKLVDHISADDRTWANFDDVHMVEMEIRNTLRSGHEQTLAFYIRDILNDAEDINSWQPNPALPLAIALGDARRKGVPTSRLYDEAKATLSSWFDSIGGNEKISLSYDDQQFDEHLRILEERGVLREKEFTSVLIEDWLQGLVKSMDSLEWTTLIQNSATKRIRMPSLLRQIETDGEARIKCSIGETDRLAYRITSLRTAEDRLKFLQTKEVLENLKKRIAEGTPGSEYIFRIVDVGLSADCASDAVQVYRWVDGVDLSGRVGELPAVYVADLGIKLSRALQFLHGSNILHRDISPRNIVLADEGGDPVVIDFGFARRLTPALKTRVDGDYSAPEVSRPEAEWTKAADIYSLGATLKAILRNGEGSVALRAVLDACVHESPDKRPDASSLIRLFDQAGKELHIEAKTQRVWEDLQAICSEDMKAQPWFRELIRKFKGNFSAVALGCHPLQFDRCREAANFINQTFEGWASRSGAQLSIGLVKDDNASTGNKLSTDAIKFIHWMRNQHAHARLTSKLPSFIKASPTPEKRMYELTIQAAEQIGAFVGLSSLPAAIPHLLGT